MNFCTLCGFAGGVRNGQSRCVDQDECVHRQTLEALGRPRASACRCLEWPCPCACHAPSHDPPLAPNFSA